MEVINRKFLSTDTFAVGGPGSLQDRSLELAGLSFFQPLGALRGKFGVFTSQTCVKLLSLRAIKTRFFLSFPLSTRPMHSRTKSPSKFTNVSTFTLVEGMGQGGGDGGLQGSVASKVMERTW